MHDGIEGTKWLSGTEVEKKFVDDRRKSILEQINQYYRESAEPYISEHFPSISSKSTLWHYYRAYSLVSSRAFLVDAYHGLAMVPIADAFNHVVENHVHLESDFHVCPECGSLFECPHDRDEASLDLNRDGTNSFARVAEDRRTNHDNTYEMVSNIHIYPDSEVFNTYGETLTNAQLLWQYSFILDANENDRITWTVDQVFHSIESEMAGRRIRRFLKLFEDLNNLSLAGLLDQMQNSNLTFVDTEPDDNILGVDAEGKISHRLWLLLFLIASDGMVDEDDLILSAGALVDFLGSLENQTDGDEIVVDPMNTSLLLEMGHLISVICSYRRARIGKPGVEDKEMGNLLDVLPDNMPRTKAALSIAISEKSILNTCESNWTDLMKVFDDQNSLYLAS
ncbi:hypothetical protein BDQ17DRAFT_1344408 [Cyathus striatus]|nr:hypothetical protein BDQ17DRAFT_1344408 [Cyathus striatus]